jgi:hypothetical protein
VRDPPRLHTGAPARVSGLTCALIAHLGHSSDPGASLEADSHLRAAFRQRERWRNAARSAPLFDGGQLPATYSEIMRDTGLTMKQARDRVRRICQLYEDQLPSLAARITERREHELDAGERRLLPTGVWAFGEPAEERARRRILALPDYYEVAHFLHRNRRLFAPPEAYSA